MTDKPIWRTINENMGDIIRIDGQEYEAVDDCDDCRLDKCGKEAGVLVRCLIPKRKQTRVGTIGVDCPNCGKRFYGKVVE